MPYLSVTASVYVRSRVIVHNGVFLSPERLGEKMKTPISFCHFLLISSHPFHPSNPSFLFWQ